MLNQLEMKILKAIAENHLVTKPELVKMLNGVASTASQVSAVESAARSLIHKKLLTAINPIGSTCYIITQRGVKLLEEL